MNATGGHVLDPNPDQQCRDVCLYCGKPVQCDVYGSGLLFTTAGRNFECYGN